MNLEQLRESAAKRVNGSGAKIKNSAQLSSAIVLQSLGIMALAVSAYQSPLITCLVVGSVWFSITLKLAMKRS